MNNLAATKTSALVARRPDLSVATGRTHQAYIFDKTETRGQVGSSSLRVAMAVPLSDS
jgi:hypothetical protein